MKKVMFGVLVFMLVLGACDWVKINQDTKVSTAENILGRQVGREIALKYPAEVPTLLTICNTIQEADEYDILFEDVVSHLLSQMKYNDPLLTQDISDLVKCFEITLPEKSVDENLLAALRHIQKVVVALEQGLRSVK